MNIHEAIMARTHEKPYITRRDWGYITVNPVAVSIKILKRLGGSAFDSGSTCGQHLRRDKNGRTAEVSPKASLPGKFRKVSIPGLFVRKQKRRRTGSDNRVL